MTTPANATLPPISCSTTIAHDGTVLCSWSNNPVTRGTLNILWLCVSTLALCVWNAVHPDVPYPGTPRWRTVIKRVRWLCVGLFMPEMLVLTALGQFRQAYNLLLRVSRETRVPTEFPWWMAVIERLRPVSSSTVQNVQYHRQNPPLSASERAIGHPSPELQLNTMTTLTLTPASESQTALSGTPAASSSDAMTGDLSGGEQSARRHPWTLTHSFYAVMRGFIAPDGDPFWTAKVHTDGYPYTHFDPEKGMQYLRAAPGSAIPDLSADDLDDRSKAGAIAKAFLVSQFSVFIANCAARWNQSLPLSLLEITTLAHSLCSLIALALWWYKPHSVGEPIMINPTLPLPPPRPHGGYSMRGVRVKLIPGETLIDVPRTITIIGIAVLYGVPHLLGLSVRFSTSTERLCWQIATSMVIGLPLLLWTILWISQLNLTVTLSSRRRAALRTLERLMLILLILYPIASMYLVGESVRQVFALPEGSFHEPELTRYLPSFS